VAIAPGAAPKSRPWPPLARLSACATTGIGSVPFEDAPTAIAHVWAAYDLPFCPQLPALEGDMLSEWLGAPAHRCGWSPERDRVRPCAWPELLHAVEALPPPAGLVKLQVTGPCTLAWALERAGHPGEAAGLARELGAWLAANAAACVADLAARGAGTLLVVDEPALEIVSGLGLDPPDVWAPLAAAADAWGLHVCCRPPWALVDEAAPDVVFCDVARHPLSHLGADVLARTIERGGMVGLGVLPLDGSATVAGGLGAARLASAALRAAGIDGPCLAASTLITPACGTGLLTPDGERRLAAAAGEIAGALRAGA
jgi:hypothetical protein